MITSPFRGGISLFLYPLLAPLLLLLQHGAVWLAFHQAGLPLQPDLEFWLIPLRKISDLRESTMTDSQMAAAFAVGFLSSGALAALSFRRAGRSGYGFFLAILAIVPGLQPFAILALSPLPLRADRDAAPAAELRHQEDGEEALAPGANVAHVLQGVLAGVGIIVGAVVLSALAFGAYGAGLFLLTPVTVGMTTAYLANRRTELSSRQTNLLVLAAATLGGIALILFALEGVICLIMASPLVLPFAWLGGALGRHMAQVRNGYERPLMAIALLPALFALEGAVPPETALQTRESIDVAAPPAAVWRALTAGAPIAVPPGLAGRAGLAYPMRGSLTGSGVGATRIGYFSTGIARERVTAWQPGRQLAFRLLSQPPAMDEMSPYRRVHAPHLLGYFDTAETSFDLQPLPGGGTRLFVTASHRLRIAPVPYWEPIARWAARENSRRVLLDLKLKAERGV